MTADSTIETQIEPASNTLSKALAKVSEATQLATTAFDTLPKKPSKPAPKPKRGKRKRSRQCRGGRRRNMLRAAERSLEAGADEQEQQMIVREAQLAGAIPTPKAPT